MMSLVMLGSMMAVIASFFLPVAYLGYKGENQKLLGMSEEEKRRYLAQNPSPYDLEAEVVEVVEEVPQYQQPYIEEINDEDEGKSVEDLQKKILYLQQLQHRQYNR